MAKSGNQKQFTLTFSQSGDVSLPVSGSTLKISAGGHPFTELKQGPKLHSRINQDQIWIGECFVPCNSESYLLSKTLNINMVILYKV
jgi:hypothetical protein